MADKEALRASGYVGSLGLRNIGGLKWFIP